MSIKTINLEQYDALVLADKNSIHSQILKFANAYSATQDLQANQFIEIAGCEIPVYIVLINDNIITFACKSKILRAYIFCLIINYYYQIDGFNFAEFTAKYDLELLLTPARISALSNIQKILDTYNLEQVKQKLQSDSYQFI